MEGPTICHRCQHCDKATEPNYCSARGWPRPELTNYVTGAKYRLPIKCVDVNAGACPHYLPSAVTEPPF